jgi:hypothetical protein
MHTLPAIMAVYTRSKQVQQLVHCTTTEHQTERVRVELEERSHYSVADCRLFLGVTCVVRRLSHLN